MSQKKHKDRTVLFKEPIFQITEVIFAQPSRTFYIRELQRETGLSTTAVISAIETLGAQGIVTIEDTKVTRNIRPAADSANYYRFKSIFNVYRLNYYGLIDDLIAAFNNPKAIVLFGSYAKGEDTEKSDIDLAIIGNSKVSAETISEKYEKVFKRPINIVQLQSLESSASEFKNALANGIVLYGYIKVI